MTDSDVKKAESLGLIDVFQLWQDIKDGTVHDWNSGRALEYLIVRAFQLDVEAETELLGTRWPFGVTYPQKIGNVEQIDGIAYLKFCNFIIESKDYNQPLDVEPLAKLRQRLEKRPPGTMGILFGKKGFTDPARIIAQFANPLNVLLMQSSDLNYAIKEDKIQLIYVVREMFRHAVELGLPDLGVQSKEQDI